MKLVMPLAERAPEVLDYFVRNREFHAETNPSYPSGFFTEEYWRARLERNLAERAADKSARHFIEVDGRIVGTANLSDFVRGAFHACYLGYSLDFASQGRGVMTTALRELIRIAFEDLHLHRIMANHLHDNVRSARVLERLGFEREGLARQYLFINGAWRDHVLTSLTNSAWTPPT